MKLFLVLLLLAASVWGRKYNTAGGPKAGKLNVHMVPHTHNDVGWLKTVDEYFWGANNTIQNAGVQYILDTVVSQLQKNPDRKFIYVETGFFARWWDEQDDATKSITRQLHDNGQLVFINGGWSMHDEANPHYTSMTDQTTWGHRFLKENLNAIPKAGWQIDPFGHSGTQAALLTAETGFVGFYFARIDYQDYNKRSQPSDRGLEVVWRGSPSLGAAADTFAGAFYRTTYGPPQGFDWSVFSNDEPVMDDHRLENYNVDRRVDEFVAYCEQQAQSFRTDNIILTMGSDFQYQDADHWYRNMDRLIHYVNKRGGRVNAFYSDPVTYTLAKNAANETWPLKTDDWFPLENGPHKFWSGFFTSRPAFKRMVRESSSYYTYARQVVAQAGTDNSKLAKLIEAIGMGCHHDAITGTEKQHTVFDYQLRLAVGRTVAQGAVLPAVKILTDSDKDFSECIFLNTSLCTATSKVGTAPTGGMNVTVSVYNPSSHPRTEMVRIPVGGMHIEVSYQGIRVPAEVVASQQSTNNYKKITGLPYTVVFEAKIPPHGFMVYDVHNGSPTVAKPQSKKSEASGFTISNGILTVSFATDGKMNKIENVKEGVSAEFNQDWLYYRANAGDGVSPQASGAYVFRPSGQVPHSINSDAEVKHYKGALSETVDMKWENWAYQRVTLDKGSNFLEIDYTIGPIPITDTWGKEVINKFTTDIKSAEMYYTDSNGRDMQTRKRNYRKYWKFDNTEPVAGNYFPVPVAQYIKDATRQLTVITDSPQSGGSIHDGEIEMMVHRRLLHDDHYGVGEPLNETQYITPYGERGVPNGEHYGPALIIRGKHWVTLSKPASAASVWRRKADEVYYKFQPAFSPGAWAKIPTGSTIATALPPQVQVMTVERIAARQILLRLSHQYAVGDDPVLSKPATVDLTTIFKAGTGLKITSAEEMSLTANQRLADVTKLHWKVEGEEDRKPIPKRKFQFPNVVLTNMQIRTFICGTE